MERDPFRNLKWFVLGYFVLLILILTVIGIFGQLGYMFIDMGLACGLFGLLVCSALITGTVWLVKRFYSKAAKILAGSIGVLLTFASAVALAMACSLLVNFGVPAHYTTLTSETSRAAVVMRTFSTNEELRALRAESAQPADGEQEDAESIFADMGFSYCAYPRSFHFFYNNKRPAEGSLEIGCSSSARLMYEWTEADTLHLFIGDAERGDEGELVLKLN